MAGVSPLPAEIANALAPPPITNSSPPSPISAGACSSAHRSRPSGTFLRAIVGFSITGLALGGAAFLAPLSYISITDRHPGNIAIALWIVFIFWQLYPLLGSLASVLFRVLHAAALSHEVFHLLVAGLCLRRRRSRSAS